MRILITGITGFAGSWLAEALAEDDRNQLFGVSRNGQWPDDCAHLKDFARLQALDLTDRAATEALIREIEPEQVYHLAGFASPGLSLTRPDEAWRGNLAATRSLLEAVKCWNGSPRMLCVGSGIVYGRSLRSDHVVDENSPFFPDTPYAASKGAVDLVAYQYFRGHNLDVVRARPFNHLGPRQSDAFAMATFAKQLAAVLAGKREPLVETGDLSHARDYTDVRDVVRAYAALMEKGRAGEAYNVACGTTRTMQELLNTLVKVSGATVETRRDPGRSRAADLPRMEVSTEKLRRETGWRPSIPMEQTLQDLLSYWRSRA